MMDLQSVAYASSGRAAPGPELEVVIEVPRGSFVKRGSSGSVDFISPLPCPFNYGAVPTLLGLEETFWTLSSSASASRMANACAL